MGNKQKHNRKKNSDSQPGKKQILADNVEKEASSFRKILQVGWMGLLFLLPYLRSKTFTTGSEPKFFVSLCIIIVLAAVAIIGIARRRLAWPQSRWKVLLVIYSIVLIFTTITSISPVISFFGMHPNLQTGILSNILCIFLFFIVLISQPSIDEIKSFLKIFSFVGVFVALQAIFERFGWFHVGNHALAQSRAIGILQNSDYSLSYLLFLAPLIVMHFIQEKAKTIKALFGVSALVVLLGLFVLLPEGLQSAIKAAPSYLIGYHHSEVQQSSTQASKQSDSSSSASSSDAFLDNSSNSMRFWAWKAGLEIGKKHFWTGSGAGTVQYFLPKIQQERPLSNWDDNVTTDNLHNEAIDYFATMGIFGLALYLLLWGSIFYFIIKGIKDKIPEKNILITLGSSLVLFLGFNQLLFTTIGTMFLPWTAAAIVLILTGRVAYRQKRELNFLPQVLLISVAVITSIILLIFSCRYWVADYYFGKGIKYGNDFRLFNKSVSLFPYNERYWRYYGYYNYFYNLVTKEANLGKRLEPSERERVLNESIKSLKKSVELGPISWKDWSMYGTVLLAGKDLNPDNSSQAEAAFSKAAEMSPKNVPLTIQISNAYLNINDLDQAMKYTNLALDYSNSNSATKPQVYLSFGKIYLAQNNLEKSYEMFSKAKELNHGAVNAELQYYLSQFESHN